VNTNQAITIFGLKVLLSLVLVTVALPSFSSVKIDCPCKLSMGSGSTAFLEYNLIFTEEIAEKKGLQIQLTHSDTLSLYTSTDVFGGYYAVGSSELPVINYSENSVRIESPITLGVSSGLESGFLGVTLKDSGGKVLDFVNLGSAKIFWDSSGDTIPTQGLDSIDTLADGDADNIPNFLEVKLGSSLQTSQITGNSEIEVLFTYASGAEIAESDIDARIAHIMSVANLSLSSSSVKARLKSLGSLDLGSDGGLDADDILDRFENRSSLWAQFDQQASRRPDLVIHLTSLSRLGGNLAGKANLLGGLGDGVYDYEHIYSSQKNLGVVAVDAGDRTLIHEIGHLMGLVHSARQGDDNGAFYWSRGHGAEDQFVTLMAYRSVFGDAVEVSSFSSPDYNCADTIACGVAIENTLSGANSAKSLSISALQVAAISNGFSPYFEDSRATGVVSVSSEEAIGLAGIRAIDPEDGDLSSLVQSSFRSSQSEPTIFNFLQTLTVSDSDGNTSIVERKILVLVDTDSDGLFNHEDDDDDNDGYLDENDAFPLNLFEWADFDGDGLGDNGDVDDDNDGVTDSSDAFPLDAEFSLDSDGDGIADKYEVRFGYDPFVKDDINLDIDGDGLSLLLEFKHRTFPSRADSDRDTLPDKWEIDNNSNPLIPYTQVEGENYQVCTRVKREIVCEGIYDDKKSFQQRIVDYSVGSKRSQCVVLESGELSCWGLSSSALVAATPLTFDAMQVAVGDDLACYIDRNSSIKCWGNIEFDISQFTNMEVPRDIIARGESVCALGDRSVSCWGAMGNVEIISTELLSAAALGGSHGCASFEGPSITSSVEESSSENVLGNNVCWGESRFESLTIPTSNMFSSLAIGSLNSCGTSSNGVACWGWDYNGFLDAPSNLKNAILGAGNNSICGLTLERGIDCWGKSSNGGLAPEILIDPDGDGVTSQGGLDLFPLDGEEAFDNDLDGIGNNADPDDDNDGVLDLADAFPFDENESLDTDSDGEGNNTDFDDDGDGIPDQTEEEQGTDPLDDQSCFRCQVDIASGGIMTIGTDAGETISGTDLDDELYGLGGDDSIAALDGDDTIEGGEGNDLIYAGAGDDSVNGNEGDDIVSGDSGNDALNGNAGRDVIDGGAGSNTVYGGEGSDLFALTGTVLAGVNVTTIKDFEIGLDKIASTVVLDKIEDIENSSVAGFATQIVFKDQRILVIDGIHAGDLDSSSFVCTTPSLALTNLLSYSSSTLECDSDGDGWSDTIDSCPELASQDQSNTDGDEFGDSCDLDDDNDGISDEEDLFPLDASESVDADLDGIGNNADTDDDNDGVLDGSDAFPLDASESIDTDSDGVGNNADADDDGDFVLDVDDAFPLDASESVDADLDGIGNNADTDDDNDGVTDLFDNCPYIPNSNQVNTDDDGLGNQCDPDDDNDGVTDTDELSDGTDPLDTTSCVGCSSLLDIDGNGEVDALSDGLLILRYLFGLSGDKLTDGAIGSDASRDANEIEEYLNSLVP
jgi:Ca2+-binding RTX toxin-like protein